MAWEQLQVRLPEPGGFGTKWVSGRKLRSGSLGEADGVTVGPASLEWEVPGGSLTIGDTLVYGGRDYRVDAVEKLAPFGVRDRVISTFRPASTVHDRLALADLHLDDELGLSLTVALRRRTGVVDPTTGRRALALALTVQAKVTGPENWRITGEETLADARLMVTLYDAAVDVGDRLTWDGSDHDVLQVSGLMQTDGSRRYTAALVN